MDIQIHHFSEGAKKARGLAVVIDVFRAFSVACYVFDRGAREIVAVQEVDHARQLKQQNPSPKTSVDFPATVIRRENRSGVRSNV